MKLYIVRHGQDTDNAAHIMNGHRNNPLTELGVQQARETAKRLEGKAITVIYSSPLRRAYDTAQIIADHLGISRIFVDPNLIERNYGPVLTGAPIGDIKKRATRVIELDGTTYPIEIPGGESYPEILERVTRFVDDIRLWHSEDVVLVVSHASSGRTLRIAWHGWPCEEVLKHLPFGNGEIIELQ